MDFGIARAVAVARCAFDDDADAAVIGTANYLSPEQRAVTCGRSQ